MSVHETDRMTTSQKKTRRMVALTRAGIAGIISVVSLVIMVVSASATPASVYCQMNSTTMCLVGGLVTLLSAIAFSVAFLTAAVFGILALIRWDE